MNEILRDILNGKFTIVPSSKPGTDHFGSPLRFKKFLKIHIYKRTLLLKFHQFYSAILLQSIQKMKGDITVKNDIPLETLKLSQTVLLKPMKKEESFIVSKNCGWGTLLLWNDLYSMLEALVAFKMKY